MKINSLRLLLTAIYCLLVILKAANSMDRNDYSKEEHNLLQLVNAQRKKIVTNDGVGLPPLLEDNTLMQVARTHSLYMASNGMYVHEDHQGKRAGERVKASGYCAHNYSSENIHRSIKLDLEGAVQAWVDSPGHLTNIVNNNFEYTGVGIAKGIDGKMYFTQVFSRTTPIYK